MILFEIVNYAALIGKLLLFLINAVGLELVLWGYVANRHTRPSRLILLGVFFVLLWVNLDMAALLAPAAALWAVRSLYALLAVFFAGFYVFALNFPARNHIDRSRRAKENIQIAAWTFFFAISFTPMVVKGIIFNSVQPLLARIDPGPLFWIYALYALLTFLFSLSELSRNRRYADPGNRARARYAALGAGLFGILNLVFNFALAAFGGGLEYAGLFSIFINFAFIVFLAYLVYRAVHDKLFGIKVILVEIFVGLMGAGLVMMPFFIEVIWQKIMLAVLFLFFCGFSYLLVKGTAQEYREKEILEQKVMERTKELENAKQNLEEINSVLEVRVGARTRELEKLNRTLEEKIAARTNDLEAKIKDLETFQRITVGRELKMIDLKKEIEYLRAVISDTQKSI